MPPTVTTTGSSGGEGLTTVEKLTKQNIMVISGKFAKLLRTVRKKLKKIMKEDEIMEDLRQFILELFPDISPDLIPNSSDLNEIFEAMRRNRLWSYMNYFALEQIVQEFGGEDPEMTDEMEKFKKDLGGFQLATKIKAYIPAAKAYLCEHESQEQLTPVNPDHYAKLSLIVDECVADYSLDYLKDLWARLLYHTQLPPIQLLFEIIRRGSIQIVFLIPTRLVPRVIRQAKHSAYFYEMHHIRSVIVGDTCVYESKCTEKGSLVTMTTKQVIPEEESTLVQTKDLVGGYDCDFVEPPPAGLQTECSVCQQILREPHMVDCCCYRFCQSCINRIKVDGKGCPLCNATTFELMHDRQLERSLKDLEVRCTHAKRGCQWTGELRLLDKHLNENPKSETLLQGCDFIEIKCMHCGSRCRRKLLTSHQIEECRKWPTHRDSMDQQKPTFKELQKYVVLHVASKWEDLGIELNLDDDGTVVNSISEKRGGDEAKCCLDVLKAWLQGKGEEPKTWRTLVGCLREIKAEEAIRSIEKNILKSMASKLDTKETRHDQITYYQGCEHFNRARRPIKFHCGDTIILCEYCARRKYYSCPRHPSCKRTIL